MLGLCIFLSWFRQEDLFTEESNIKDRGLKMSLWWICLAQRLSFLLNKTLIDGLEWCGYLWIIVMFLSTVWTLILTAPIHCRGADVIQLMKYIYSNLFKQINLPKGKYIFSKFLFWGNYSINGKYFTLFCHKLYGPTNKKWHHIQKPITSMRCPH